MVRLLVLLLLFIVQICEAQKLKVQDLNFDSLQIIGCTPVKDQYLSATCWSFASNSFLESELIKKGKGQIDLSEMFIARYSMKRKIERHLQLNGNNFFTPGGQFHDVIWVIKNYGIVPEHIYTGKSTPEQLHDHGDLDTVISHYVKKLLREGVTALNQQQTKYVDSVLDYYLGIVPNQFRYEGKMITPKTYLKEVLELNPDDYIEITSYTHHPFYKAFVLEDKYNWTNDSYYNVSLQDFSGITNAALKNGYTIGWDGDVDDPDFDYASGLAYLPVSIADYQAYRQKAFEEQSTLLDHLMHIIGSTKDKFDEKWYLIKNSWGDNTNALKGYLFMREDYFKIRTVAIIVNKKAIPSFIRSKLNL